VAVRPNVSAATAPNFRNGTVGHESNIRTRSSAGLPGQAYILDEKGEPSGSWTTGRKSGVEPPQSKGICLLGGLGGTKMAAISFLWRYPWSEL